MAGQGSAGMASGVASGRRRQSWRGVAVAMLVAALVTACAPIIRNHGYVPTEADLARIAVGVDTRETVAEAVGRPSAQGLLNDTGWFYVQSRYRTVGPRPPVEEDRQVVAITFASNGRVSNIERFGLEQGKVVTLSRRVTESNIRGISIVRALFQNFGRLSAGDLLQ